MEDLPGEIEGKSASTTGKAGMELLSMRSVASVITYQMAGFSLRDEN
jgi:hypothetical protein